jgi:glycosyltransferase involved in cell wall biosynthesis
MQDYVAPHVVLLETLARRAEEFDIIHLHVDYLGYPLLQRTGVPFMATLHGRLDLPELKQIYRMFSDVPVVSISDSQREPLPEANFVDTIYHGLPKDLLPMGHGKDGYLAFIGRISPEKAPDAAIRIAGRAGMKIKIAAKVDRVDREYFERHIEPLLSQPHVEFIGEINEEQKADFLGNAAGLLFPIAWREPFGLAMIEAMSCGTPVIAMRNGSVPEVIDEGVTGFIVRNEDEAVAAVARLGSLSRAEIRRTFEQRFTAQRMAEDYAALYRRLIAGHQPAQLMLA